MYPYCTIEDVEIILLQGAQGGMVYTDDTRPTRSQVREIIDRISASLRSIVSDAGYDVDNLHGVSTTASQAITAGSDVDVDVGDSSGFSVGDTVKLEGLDNGIRVYEFCKIKNISNNIITLDNVDNDYDIGCKIIKVNTALKILRDICMKGAAAEVDQISFMGISPVKPERAKELWAQYWGSENMPCGIWAIRNIANYLEGATRTTKSVKKISISSYGSENPDDINEWITIDKEF